MARRAWIQGVGRERRRVGEDDVRRPTAVESCHPAMEAQEEAGGLEPGVTRPAPAASPIPLAGETPLGSGEAAR
jgi:hypothetical protein